MRKLASTHHTHEMEVDRKSIVLCETLGEGAFGVVRRGALLPHKIDVAVKMLKGEFRSATLNSDNRYKRNPYFDQMMRTLKMLRDFYAK